MTFTKPRKSAEFVTKHFFIFTDGHKNLKIFLDFEVTTLKNVILQYH